MKYFNFVLLLIALFSIETQAQNDKTNQPKDRFSYSYGVLLGDNLKKMDFTMDMISLEKLVDGTTTYLKGANPSVTELAAQQVINNLLNKITENKTAKEQGKTVEPISKSSLEEFSYNYGVIIGVNLKNFGATMADFSTKDFEAGYKALFTNKDLKINTEDAQNEVTTKYQGMLKARSDKQLVANQEFMDKNKKRPNVISLASGIQYEVLVEGKGKQATAENSITAHYHGTLIDGTVFDSSVERGEPINFKLSGVIKGWQELIPLMKEGGKIRAYIPPHMGYGARERGKIPANALLIFEIELIQSM